MIRKNFEQIRTNTPNPENFEFELENSIERERFMISRKEMTERLKEGTASKDLNSLLREMDFLRAEMEQKISKSSGEAFGCKDEEFEYKVSEIQRINKEYLDKICDEEERHEKDKVNFK